MQLSLLAAAVLPAFVLSCENPNTHVCAAAFVDNPYLAASFCASYLDDDTVSVPDAFSTCGSKTSHLSSACSCYATATATAPTLVTTPAAISVTSAKSSPTTLSTLVRPIVSSIFLHSTPTVTSPSTGEKAVTSAAVVAASAVSVGAGASSMSTVTGGSGVGGTTCTVIELSAVSAAAKSCSNILLSDVTVSASSTLSVTVPSNGALLFAGTMTVEYTPDADYTPIVIKGTNAKVAGLEGAVIDGSGAQYWDGQGSNGGTDKPDHFIKLSDLEASSFTDLTIRNWPTHLFEITGCSDLTMGNLILDNSAGNELDSDGDALGHNTDAFDVSSTDGLYVYSATVSNQDDCVAVNSGSNMVFENLYCDGSHGLSIGSIKSDVTVSNVTFQDSTVINGQNGCRIKTTAGESGSTVSDITYSNIYVSNLSAYAIDVQQDYENGSPTGDPTTGIPVSNVIFENISGDVTDDGYQYYILCGSTTSCSDISFSNIDISGGSTECSPSSLCGGA